MRALAAVVLAVALPAAAQEEEQKAPKLALKPGDKLIALAAEAVGTWKCAARVTHPDAEPAEMPATVKIEAVVAGHAYAVDYATQPKGGAPLRVMSVWSQDPMTGKLTEAGWDSQGGSWRGTSVGPRGEKTVWEQEGTAFAEPLRMRTTWLRKGPKELQRITELKQVDGGGWVRIHEETCRR